MQIALFEPRIPQNTGNIARTCAAYNLDLNLILPLGYSLEDKYLKRAGLDYWPLVNVNIHDNFKSLTNTNRSNRIIAFSKFAQLGLHEFTFQKDDILLFGREDNGLPESIKSQCNHSVSLFMPINSINKDNGVRSLNLAVACGIAIYKAYEELHLQ
tara:strand:+ start:4639 stop:5106 length:468 start_codon:yes stop_codon:yes gene_type:complete